LSLKQKSIKSFNWTLLELLLSQGTTFLVGILLARILTPKDFGIIGIITVFLAVSNTILESGLSSALLRKNNTNEKDYNTIFYVNLIVGFLLYTLIICLSPNIAKFFEIPILEKILKYAGIVLIFNALSIIQRTVITKKLGFKLLAIISIISSFLSGALALVMAYSGYGVWSLVVLTVIKPLIHSILFWFLNSWRPRFLFSKESFKELFDYGYKVLVANLINTIYKNIYYILIGKLFSPVSLGYYTRADQFQSPISGNITRAIGKISFPILSTLQNDDLKLNTGFIRFLKFSLFLTGVIMSGIAAMAKPLILLLIGSKWSTSILYLQLLCIPGILYPLQILHLNLLLIKGYSNLNLKLEIIKKVILLPLIYFTALMSINAMLYGVILFSIIEYFINSYYTKRLINYSVKNQLADIAPFIFLAFTIFVPMYATTFLNVNLLFMFIIQVVIGILTFITVNEFLKLEEYKEIKMRVLDSIKYLIS
jgi:O-antigen/teichoic acid export membrane protein